MRMTEQLIALGECWSAASNRSLARLATRVQNDSKFFDRMRDTQVCTTQTFEKFLSFFRDASNWPDAVIPLGAAELLENFENIAHEAAADGGNCQGVLRRFDELSAQDGSDVVGHYDTDSGADAPWSTGQDDEMSPYRHGAEEAA